MNLWSEINWNWKKKRKKVNKKNGNDRKPKLFELYCVNKCKVIFC